MPLLLYGLGTLPYTVLWYYYVQVLHGDISQHQRDLTINQFRKNQFQVLVATDVAARGIDVSSVDLVVQYRPPRDSGGCCPLAKRINESNLNDNLYMCSLDVQWCCLRAVSSTPLVHWNCFLFQGGTV